MKAEEYVNITMPVSDIFVHCVKVRNGCLAGMNTNGYSLPDKDF